MANFYSLCSPLLINCVLYQDASLMFPISSGFHSDGDNCYQTDSGGKIVAITPCVSPCDLNISGVVSTDPTTLGGSDGTITVDYNTSNGPSTYSLNAAPMGAAANPLVITGLSSNVEYTIEITDSNACTASTTVTLGQTATRFDADWIMATFEFTDGADLDTRTRIAIPDIGQDAQPKYLGWAVLSSYPGVGVPIITWGGDNTGTGFESVLINVSRFKELFPSETQFTVDLRGFWFNAPGVNPVIAAVTLWKGGTPIHNGCFNFCWTNPTALFTGTIDSVPKVITLFPPNGSESTSSGERLATLKYDLVNFIAVLNNADVTTPSV